MNIIIEDLQDNIKVDKKIKSIIKTSINQTLEHEKFDKECEIGVIFVDNNQIQELNKNHRNIDSPTDVLSFPLVDFNYEVDDEFAYHDDLLMIGDIIINLQRALEQAEEYGHSFEREIGFLCVHSTLHLLGYDHAIDEQINIMRKKEEEILESMKLTRD